MNTFERMELIEEIEALADQLGVTDLWILQRLEDQTDNKLVHLRDGLKATIDERLERSGAIAI